MKPLDDEPAGGIASVPPLRVAYVCRVLWDGGVQRVAIAQVEQLRANGISCDLIFLRAAASHTFSLPSGTRILERGDREPPSGVRQLSRAATALFARHRGPEASVDLDLLWQVRRTLQAYDVVLYNDQYGGLLGAYLRLTRGQPYLLLLHEFFPTESIGVRALRPLAHFLDEMMLLLAPRVLVFSPDIAARVGRRYPGRLALLHYGAPPVSDPIPVGIRDRRSVLSLTVWDRGRHPETLLELARLAPEFKFVMAGQWADSDHFREFQRQAEGQTNLLLTGAISEERRLALLRKSLVYLRLGYGESGPGMGGLEALANGSVVISNRGLGLSKMLDSGVDGFVTEGSQPSELAEVLHRIDALSIQELESISRKASALADRFAWPAQRAELAREVVQVALRRPRRPPGSSRGPRTAEATGGRSS